MENEFKYKRVLAVILLIVAVALMCLQAVSGDIGGVLGFIGFIVCSTSLLQEVDTSECYYKQRNSYRDQYYKERREKKESEKELIQIITELREKLDDADIKELSADTRDVLEELGLYI